MSSWDGLWRVMQLLGLPEPEVPCRAGGGHVAVGWPDEKVALALETDDPRPMIADGWEVFPLPADQAAAVTGLVATLSDIGFSLKLRRSAAQVKQTISREEQVLLDALLRAGLPEPDRNHRVLDGDRLVTIPDFCWPDAGVAVFVDGWRWHVGLDLADDIAAAAAGDKTRERQLVAATKRRDAGDAAKRRWLAANGWEYVVVHDTELAGAAGPTVAADTAAAVATIWRRRSVDAAPQSPAPTG